jgi:hypothetical protein
VESTEASTTDDPDAVAVVGAIEVGGSLEGTMTGSDTEYGSSFFQAWTLAARAGDRLAIENLSEDFDSYLYLAGPGFPDPLYDDDSADNLDARICVEIPETATYRILAGPFSGENEGGRYTLRVLADSLGELCDSYEMTPEATNAMLAELPTEGREIAVGQLLEGNLDPDGVRHPETDRVIQAWSTQLGAGTEITVDLLSDAFDPVLHVLGPGLAEPLYVDDAESGVCNSRVTFSPTESGTFRVLVGAYYEGGGGPFRLRISEDPPQLEAGGCVGAPSAPGTAASTDTGPLAGVASGVDRLLDVGTEVGGTLDADGETLSTGEPAQPWTVEIRAGDEVVFELLSDDFDCILYVDDGTGNPLRDDDSAGNLDSRIVYTASEDRTVRVVVSALAAGNSGAFRLRAIRRVP